VFHQKANLEFIRNFLPKSLASHLGIEFLELGEDFLTAKMPVDHRTKQPFGILHGGASLALAETLGSVAATCVIDMSKHVAVGLDINANHIRSVKSGFVYGIAKALHIGRKTHVWEIKITNEDEKLVCISRITMAIIDRQEKE